MKARPTVLTLLLSPPLLLSTLILASLTGCARRNNFPQATDAAPDTVNYYYVPQNFGFVSDESSEVRAEKMLQVYLETFPPAEGEEVSDAVWHPGDGRGRADTLWARKGESDCYVCITQTPRPDFSHRTAEPLDTAGTIVHPALLFDSIDSPNIAERGIRLWQRFVRVRQMLGMSAPDQLVWQPSDGDDADTLWVGHGTWVFVAVSPRHAVSKDSISTAQKFLSLFGATTPADSVVVPEKTFRERISYPRGALRPVAYVALSGVGVVGLLLITLVITIVRRILRKKQQKRLAAQQKLLKAQQQQQTEAKERELEKMREETLHALRQSDVVVRMRSAAVSGKMAVATDWQELISAVDAYRPFFVPTLRKRCADLSERELHVCLLVLVGLSPSEMSSLLGCTPQAVSNTRTRLNPKLFGEQGTAQEFDERLKEIGN